MKQQWRERLGTVTQEPCAPVVAGSYQQWTLTLTVGSYGIDEGGTIKIAQRLACDMQPAQFSDPARASVLHGADQWGGQAGTALCPQGTRATVDDLVRGD